MKSPTPTIYLSPHTDPMPSPSPGANTPSSSGNGAPKLLNDYVWLQAPLICSFAYDGTPSNLAIVSGKARLVRSIVRSPNFSALPTAFSLAFRCPQLGHRRDRGREGDHVGKYSEGRDIPNNGRSHSRTAIPTTHSPHSSPQSEIDLLKNLNVCLYQVRFAY